ncbi:MAG: TolB family protein [Phycisphaerae bacterium]
MEQTGPAALQDDGNWRHFARHCILLALILAPFAYFGLLLSVAVHEIVGHGLACLCLGGQFLGFSMDLKGIGYATIFLPFDPPLWKRQLVLGAGMVATLLTGACLLWIAHKVRGVLLSLILLILSAAMLLECSEYLFWSSVWPAGLGDARQILAASNSPWLRPLFIALGVLGSLGTIIVVYAMIFRRLEAWLGNGQLRGARRAVVLAIIGLLPAPVFLFVQDWVRLAPGLGLLPGIVGTVSFVAVAAGLYWIRFRARPALVRKRSIAVAMAAGWSSAGVAVVATLLWLQNGVATGRYPETPIRLISSIEVSPDRKKVAFLTLCGTLGGAGSRFDRKLYVWPVDGEAPATEIACPGRPQSVSWSGDSSAIVFSSVETASVSPMKIMRMAIADGRTSMIAEQWCYALQCSPDGKWVAFTEYDAEPSLTDRRIELRALDIKSGKFVTLAKGIDAARSSWRWYPDSSGVLLRRGHALVRKTIADGPEQTVYTSPGGDEDAQWQIVFSPDGGSLALLEGGALRILDLRQSSSLDALSGRQHVLAFDWFCDGICYVQAGQSGLASSSELKVYSPSTGLSRTVAGGDFSSADWIAGNRIIVLRGKEGLWVYDAATGEGREIFSLTPKGGPHERAEH